MPDLSPCGICALAGRSPPPPGTNEFTVTRPVPPEGVPVAVVREAEKRGIELPGVTTEEVGTMYLCDECVGRYEEKWENDRAEYEPYRRSTGD